MAGYEVVGCDPSVMGIGPAPAMKKLFAQKGLGVTFDNVDLFEVRERERDG